MNFTYNGLSLEDKQNILNDTNHLTTQEISNKYNIPYSSIATRVIPKIKRDLGIVIESPIKTMEYYDYCRNKKQQDILTNVVKKGVVKTAVKMRTSTDNILKHLFTIKDNAKLAGFESDKVDAVDKKATADSIESLEEKYDVVSDDKRKIHKLEEENKAIKKALNDAKKEVHTSEDIRRMIYELNAVEFSSEETVPSWVNKKSKNEIIPVFCLSDTHIGSVINPEDVNFVNEYNVDIAKKRIYGLVDDFVDIYTNKMSNYKYPGCVVFFGGDMIENAMHGTEETNELTVVDQIIECTNILITVIEKLNKAFGKVSIFAVSGNHGRLIADKYVKNTNRLGNSLEKIVYHFIDVHFKANDDITIITKQSDIIHFEINGKVWRLEHGDDIKFTGQAISGPLNSFERARLKRNGVDGAIGRKFDYLAFGHFHQHLLTNNILVMDSCKGYDPYVMRMSLPYNLPGATTFSINSRGEIIFATNLKCRDNTVETKSDYIKIF